MSKWETGESGGFVAAGGPAYGESRDLPKKWDDEAGTEGRSGAQKVYSVYQFGAVGDGKSNDTAAIQRTIDAAGGGNRGVVLLPSNGSYLLGGGLHLLGHGYDGVTLQVRP